MKLISLTRLTVKKWQLVCCLVLSVSVFSTASAFLDDITSAVTSVTAGISTGVAIVDDITGLVNDVANIFGGGSSSSASAPSASVPNVPNGGILPGPGNSQYGISYVRDVFLPNLTNWLVVAILSGSVVVMVIAGLMYVLGGGNQEMTDKARETITWGIIGTVIAISAYALVRIVITINFLG